MNSGSTLMTMAAILLMANGAAFAVPVNLATGGTASASSDNGCCCCGGVGAAIDGNRAGDNNGIFFHTNFPDPNQPIFFEVDLGQNNFLDRVQISPRTNQSQDSVENFKIEVFNASDSLVFTKDYLTTTSTSDVPWGTADIRNVIGQRLQLTRLDAIPQSPDFLTFGEFEVFGQDSQIAENLAMGAGINVSTGAGFDSQNEDAIDGDFNSHFFKPDSSGIGSAGPVYHSDVPALKNFLEFDLGSERQLDYLNLFARGDCNTTGEVTVEVLEADGTTVAFSQVVYLVGIDVGGRRYDVVLDLPDSVGQFVRVTTVGNQFLAFAELELFATIVPEPSTALLGTMGWQWLVLAAVERT